MLNYRPNPIKADSVIAKAADELRRFIKVREMGDGDVLPPETQLSAMLGISRNSVREALRILDALGFIEKRPGKQALVRSRVGGLARAPRESDVIEALHTAFDVRMVIEVRCAALAATRASRDRIVDLGSEIDRFEDALRLSDYEAAARAHDAFHEGLVALADNAVLGTMYQSVHDVVEPYSNAVPTTFKSPHLPPIHRAIVTGLLTGKPEEAASAVRRHFRATHAIREFRVRVATEVADAAAERVTRSLERGGGRRSG